MDDLNTLATLLIKPEPSTEAIARSRGRLQDRMRGRTRRRIGWLVPGLGLATAAVAAVAVIATGVTTPTDAPASASEVLLMAAVSAERTPQGSGTYWHVTRWADTEMQMESWTARDGRRWSKGEPGDPPGVAVPDPGSFMLKGAKVGFEDLERLPADPEALKARIAELPGFDSAMTTSELRDDPTVPLVALISELPTPSEVRSAAFRALATMPEVESTGVVEGGQELLIPHIEDRWQIKLVVDPETARVSHTNFLPTDDGDAVYSGELISVTTGWTDQPPQ